MNIVCVLRNVRKTSRKTLGVVAEYVKRHGCLRPLGTFPWDPGTPFRIRWQDDNRRRIWRVTRLNHAAFVCVSTDRNRDRDTSVFPTSRVNSAVPQRNSVAGDKGGAGPPRYAAAVWQRSVVAVCLVAVIIRARRHRIKAVAVAATKRAD